MSEADVLTGQAERYRDELRTEMEGIVKAMNAPPPKPPAARKPAPAKTTPVKK